MNAMAVALTRDFLRRSRWPAVFLAAYTFGMPALFYFGAMAHGVVVPRQFFHELPFSVNWFCLVVFMVIPWIAQGDNRFGVGPRWYVLPMPTWLVVATRMLQCSMTVAALYIFVVAVYNVSFDLSWPMLGPALVLAVCALWLQAGFWSLMDFSFSKLVTIALVDASLVWWIASHYVLDGGEHIDSWSGPAGWEWWLLGGYAAVAYLVGLEGVARHRRGNCTGFQEWAKGLDAWLEAHLRRRSATFSSPRRALLWMEWTRAGWTLPSVAASVLIMVLVFGAIRVALGATTPLDVLEVMLVLAIFAQPQMALIFGLVLGHRNHRGGRLEFDSYSATRPVSDRAMSDAILLTAGRSVLTSYVVCAGCCLPAMAWVYSQLGTSTWEQIARLHPIGPPPAWSAVLVCGISLLGTRTAYALSASAVVCGRMRLIGWIVATGLILLIAWVNVIGFLTDEEIRFLIAVTFGVIGLACLIGTATAFTIARRRELLSPAVARGSLAAWLGLCVLLCLIWTQTPHSTSQSPFLTWLTLPVYPGLLALVVAPLATMPLALSWNRHR